MYVTITGDETPILLPALIAKRTRESARTLPPGGYLYFEGDTAQNLFVIEKGVVRLTRVLEDGRRQVIAFGYPGDVIGFAAQGRYHTDCDALTDTRLLPFHRAALEDGAGDPDLKAMLLKAALREISSMQDHFMMLGRKSAAERVASFLNALSARAVPAEVPPGRIDLPMSRSDIADFLGLTTETVSRCLSALRKAGVIRLSDAHGVEVLNLAALRQRACGKWN
ncbi:MAG: helix-turn-helix domain-containing protein [Rhodobacteraceae bacterium]|nr:helix-turn-helix domain-containing protein [Paracoccaceae bacterium]